MRSEGMRKNSMPTQLLSTSEFRSALQREPLSTRWARGLNASVYRQSAETGDGVQVGIFIRLPSEMSDQFPPLTEDSSPRHVTVLYAGEIDSEHQADFLDISERHLRDVLKAPISAKFDGLDFFSSPEGKVQHVKLRFSQDISLARKRIIDEMRGKGYKVADHSHTMWRAHTTLAYGAEQYNGAVPKGRWDFDTFEIWGLPQIYTIKLG